MLLWGHNNLTIPMGALSQSRPRQPGASMGIGRQEGIVIWDHHPQGNAAMTEPCKEISPGGKSTVFHFLALQRGFYGHVRERPKHFRLGVDQSFFNCGKTCCG
jgi:hypothetical protein